MQRLLTYLAISFCIAHPAAAQEIPGRLSGTLGERSIEIPLDCSLWGNEQSQVYAAGDARSGRDRNGDAVSLSFSYMREANILTDMFVTIDQTRFNLGPVWGSDDPLGGWVIDTDTARLTGQADNFGNPISVDLLLDCAPRSAAERGFTGIVAGLLDGRSIESPLYCGEWVPGGFTEAKTEEEVLPFIELTVFPSGTEGSIVVTTAEKEYRWTVIALTGMSFETTDDTVVFSAELKEQQTNRDYNVELAFFCPNGG